MKIKAPISSKRPYTPAAGTGPSVVRRWKSLDGAEELARSLEDLGASVDMLQKAARTDLETTDVTYPTLTGISPSCGQQGASVNITLTGTGLSAGTPTIVTDNSGITVTTVVIVSDLSVTATFVIAAGASIGTANVSLSIFGKSSGSVSFTVLSPLKLRFSGAAGQVGVDYATPLLASGGVTPYIFAIHAGTLPAGLSLDTATGAITGTPTTAGSSSFTARVTDSAGTVVDLPCVINIATPSGGSVILAITSATGRDEGHGTDIPDSGTRLVTFLVGVTTTFASTPTQYGLIWLTEDGANWVPINWYLWTSSGQEISFYRDRPVSASTWKVAVTPGTVNFDPTRTVPTASLPTGTVLSVGFSVAGLSLPSASNITTLSIDAGIGGNFPFDEVDADGFHDWCVQFISFDPTTARNDPNTFTVILTCQDLDSGGAPIGPEHIYGTPQVLAQGTVQDFGMLNGPYGQVATPARSGNIGKVRLRVRCGNRTDQTTEAWRNTAATTLQNIDGVGYRDIVVSVLGTTPTGVVAGSRDASTNRTQEVSRIASAKAADVAVLSGSVDCTTIDGNVLINPGGAGVLVEKTIAGVTSFGQVKPDHLIASDGVHTADISSTSASLAGGKFTYDANGRFTKYDNTALVGKGVAFVPYKNDWVNLFAAGLTNNASLLLAAGHYRVSLTVDTNITAGAGVGTAIVAVTFSRTLGFGFVSASSVPSITINWGDNSKSIVAMCRTDGALSTDLSVAGIGLVYNVTTGFTNGSFNIHIVVEKVDDY